MPCLAFFISGLLSAGSKVAYLWHLLGLLRRVGTAGQRLSLFMPAVDVFRRQHGNVITSKGVQCRDHNLGLQT